MRHNIKVYISGCLLQLLKCHLVAVRGKADSGSKWHLPGRGLSSIPFLPLRSTILNLVPLRECISGNLDHLKFARAT